MKSFLIFLAFLAPLLTFAEELKQLTPKLQSGDTITVIEQLDQVGIDALVQDKYSDVPIVSGGEKPQRAIFAYNHAGHVTSWREQHSHSSAELVADIGPVNCGAYYQVVKVRLTNDKPDGSKLNSTTWSCEEDENLQALVSDCDSEWNGGAIIDYDEEPVFVPKNSNPSTVRFPITQTVKSRPDFLMIKRVKEEKDRRRSCSRGNGGGASWAGCAKCGFQVESTQVEITADQLVVATDENFDFPGCDHIPKTVYDSDLGEYVTIDAWICHSSREKPDDNIPTHTTVQLVGVPWNLYSVTDAYSPNRPGEFTRAGDHIFISQRGQGSSECKLQAVNGTFDPARRGKFHFDLLFEDPNGFCLKPGWVSLHGQDQGSSGNLFIYAHAISEGKGHYFNNLQDYEGWFFNAWCPYSLASQGLCNTAYVSGPPPNEFDGFGFNYLWYGAQLGDYFDTDPTTSAGANIHSKWNFFYPDSTEAYCTAVGGIGEADTRTQFPLLDAADAGCFPFFHGGALLQRYCPASEGNDAPFYDCVFPAEQDFAVSFWAEGADEWECKRIASGRSFPMNIYVPVEQPECGPGTNSPTCDPEDILIFLVDAQNAANHFADVAHKMHTRVGTFMTQQSADGIPGYNTSYVNTAIWPNYNTFFPPANPLTVEGQFTANAGATPVGGHGSAGGFVFLHPDYIPLRNSAMATSGDLSGVINKMGAHADMTSGSMNVEAWADNQCNIVGLKERAWLNGVTDQ